MSNKPGNRANQSPDQRPERKRGDDPNPNPKRKQGPSANQSPERQRGDDAGQPPVRVNFDFRRELAEKIEGDLASFCYQCGACVGDCPAATYSSTFNPREIMLKVLYGLGDELLKENSVLWECTNCYNCHERCPQEVKPVEVIISLKNMLADRGIYPDPVSKVIKTFEETGRTTPVGSAVQRQRERFGLPPLPPVPMDEIRKLIEPAESQGGKA